MDNYKDLENKFQQLLSSMKNAFTQSEVIEVVEYIDVGEYGVAFETLCAILEEEQKEISNESYKRVVELGLQMDFDQKVWSNLRVKRDQGSL